MPEFDSTIEYRDVPGFPGYKVGSDGSVWTCKTVRRLGYGKGTVGGFGTTWKRRKTYTTPCGHLGLHLWIGDESTYKLVHRLVLEAFVGPCPTGMECCHNDGNPANNNLTNLRWDTKQSNIADAVKHGVICRGEKHGRAKLTTEQVRRIREECTAGTASQQVIANKYGVTQMLVSKIFRRRVWRHIQ